MKLAVLTCAVFPSKEESDRKRWIFLRSWERFGAGFDLHEYGIGRIFPAYKVMMLDWQLEYLKTIQDRYSHCLFTDSWDCFLTGSMGEIVSKYMAFGSPAMLQSAYTGLANVSEPDKDYPDMFDKSLYAKHPHVGGWIGEIPLAISNFERMLKLPRQTGDNCFNHYDAWAEKWFRPMLDSNCEIFQVTSSDCAVEDGRLVNTVTKSKPCLYHISGGYTDPETGKDDRLIPWAKSLGIL